MTINFFMGIFTLSELHVNEFCGYSFLGKKQDNEQKQDINRPADEKALSGNKGDHIGFQGRQIEEKQRNQRQAVKQQAGKGEPHLKRAVVDIGIGGTDAREHVLEYIERVLKGGGPEKDPGKAYQQEGDRNGDNAQQGVQPSVGLETGAFFVPWEKAFDNLKRAVNAAPEHIVPACAVPQAADQEGDHDVECMPDASHPVSSQRDIDIVSQPAGKGDMPSSPEILNGRSKIGGTEVGGQADAQNSGGTKSDIRISREVAVKLNGIEKGGKNQCKAGEGCQIAINLVHIDGKPVRQHQLLEKSPGHQLQTVGSLFVMKTAGLMKLGKQGSSPFDGALHDLREKGNVYRIDSEMPFRGDFSLIYVNQIADRLKQVKGNSDGKRELQGKGLHGNGKLLQQSCHVFGKEVQVFKEKQKSRAEQDGQDEDGFGCGSCPPAPPAVWGFVPFLSCPFHIQRRVIGNDDGEKQHRKVFQPPGGIEKKAGSQQQHPAPFPGSDPVQKEYDRQKNGVAE